MWIRYLKNREFENKRSEESEETAADEELGGSTPVPFFTL